jgi:hypothetical protein
MSAGKVAIVGFVTLVIGALAGMALGYSLWARELTEVARLNHELDKTRGWLLDEINWSDERCSQVSAALTKAQTDLVHVRRELELARRLAGGPDPARATVSSEAASPGPTR